jgi:hypothetical protein
MAFIVKRDAPVIPAGIPVSSTNQISIAGYSVNTNTSFIKKNTFNQFLGNPTWGGDVAYMGNGTAYVLGYYDGGGDRFGIIYVLLAPNSTIMDNPSPAGNWMGPFSNWRLLEFYSDDGTQTTIISENPSTNANYIPTTNWSPSLSINSTSILGLPRQILVAGVGNSADGIYTITASAGVYTPAPINGTYNYLLGDGIFYITSFGNTNYNGDINPDYWNLAIGNDTATVFAYNTSTDVNNVPTIGWIPSATITAA